MIETLFLLILLVGILANFTKRPKNFPPGPIGLPILGFYHCIDNNNSERTWEALYKKFGSMVGFFMGPFKVVLISGWLPVRAALANEDCNGRPDVCLLRDRFGGENYGVAFTDGDNWKVQRRFALHHFRNLGFGRKSHESVVIEEARQLVSEIKTHGLKPIDMECMVTSSLVNIIWSLFGGCRYPLSDPLLKGIADNIQESMKNIKPYGSVACVVPLLRFILPEYTGYNSIRNSSTAMQNFFLRTISEHRLTRTNGSPRDFIDVYLDELATEDPERHPSFSIKQLQGICMDLLCAGVDTSSGAVRFTIFFLCLNPELQEKVREEVLSVVGTDRRPCMDDKINLVLTQAVLLEVLRMRTPAPTFLPHRATKDTSIENYHIPKDTLLFINLRSILMDKTYWKDPEVFRPQRFISEDGKLKPDERLIFFGKGKRSCIGEVVAKMVALIMTATLLQNFRFNFPEGDTIPSDEGVLGFTLNPPEFRVIATPLR